MHNNVKFENRLSIIVEQIFYTLNCRERFLKNRTTNKNAVGYDY